MAKVVNRGPNALCLRAEVAPRQVKELDLEVGASEVNEADLLEILGANAYALQLFDLQCEMDGDGPGEQPADVGTRDFKGGRIADLSLLKQAEALKAIAACKDADQLRAWVLTDARPAVKKALHLRDRDLRPADVNEDTVLTKVS